MDYYYIIGIDIDCLHTAWQALVEAANQMAMSFQEAWDRIRAILIETEDLWEKPMSPREYGISLLHLRRDRYSQRTYNYIPSIKRHMPYQRRCFNRKE